MKTLNYQIAIDAPKKLVWEAIVDPEKFKIWSKAFSPNSSYTGTWKEGAEINFVDEGRGGTVARIDEFKPFDRVVATHIAMLTPELKRETTGDLTEKWIGTKEIYDLEESNGQTLFKVEMQSDPEFTKMMEDSWPQALKNLKELVES